jgi:Glycosyl hydrolase family 47
MCCFAARSFNGWCLSYIESLDTLWLMGLYEEFDGALAVVTNITFFMPPVSLQFIVSTWPPPRNILTRAG